MKVYLTGAFGNIGESALLALLKLGHEVTCFDIQTPRNEKKMNELLKVGKFNTIWGDITNIETISNALLGNECIIHLAAIIPPFSEKNPELTRRVNIEGTKNLITVASGLEPKPKFIFTSSISVHGPRMNSPPPRKADEELNPTDQYTHSKVACEKMILKSDLPWTILRLGAVPPFEMNMESGDVLFDMPLDQRVEFVHTRDVGLALANAVEADTLQKILLIGGGKNCQMLNREFIRKTFEAYGIGMLDELAFKIPKNDDDWYYTDWVDSSESQKLLKYQNMSFDEYLLQVKKQLGRKRFLFKLLSPIIKWYLRKKSRYYKENRLKK
ncbi:MAG: NAD-dependent epimerase/dehydratase family protein [Candidatus Helarchaeota archaeon]